MGGGMGTLAVARLPINRTEMALAVARFLIFLCQSYTCLLIAANFCQKLLRTGVFSFVDVWDIIQEFECCSSPLA